MTETNTPAPGWYHDPQTPGMQRYWDGQQWTTQTAPLTTPAAPTAPPTPAALAELAEPAKKKRKTGVIVGVIIGVALLLMFVVLAAVAIPIFTSQRGKAADAAARADVATLGREIATNAVDSPSMAIVTVAGDTYVISGEGIGEVVVAKSAGVELGGQTGSGSTDWCVWVVAEGGTEKTFQYSALGGLAPGRC